MYEYNAIMENVVDGDTVDMRIDLGFSVWVMERCRLLEIDTPESRTRDIREKKFGKLATQRVKELLLEGSKYTVKTQFDSKGKFGRTMVDVHLPNGRQSVIFWCQSIWPCRTMEKIRKKYVNYTRRIGIC